MLALCFVWIKKVSISLPKKGSDKILCLGKFQLLSHGVAFLHLQKYTKNGENS